MPGKKGQQRSPVRITEDPIPKKERPNLQRGKVKKTGGLTDGQIAFAQEYCMDFNKSAAALRAGFSEKNPGDAGNSLYKMPLVKELIAEIRANRAHRYEHINDIIVEELLNIATSDITDFIQIEKQNATGKDPNNLVFTPSNIWENNRGRLVKSIKIGGKGIEFSLHDKMDAIRTLAQHTGFISPDNSDGDVVINITGDRREAKS